MEPQLPQPTSQPIQANAQGPAGTLDNLLNTFLQSPASYVISVCLFVYAIANFLISESSYSPLFHLSGLFLPLAYVFLYLGSEYNPTPLGTIIGSLSAVTIVGLTIVAYQYRWLIYLFDNNNPIGPVEFLLSFAFPHGVYLILSIIIAYVALRRNHGAVLHPIWKVLIYGITGVLFVMGALANR